MKLAKLILVSLLATATIFSFTACSGSGKGTASNSANKKVTLRWLNKVESDAEAKQWKELASDVTKKYPNITVQFESIDWNGYWPKISTELASGDAPDIMYMHATRTQDYCKDGFLPLNTYIQNDKTVNVDDFYKGIMNSFTLDGQVYGFPYDFGPYIVFYNKDLFDKYKVDYPTNNMDWDGFMSRCKALTKDGNFGFCQLSNIDNNNPQILDEGATVIDASGKVKIDSPEAIAAYQKLSDMIHVQKVAPVISSPGDTIFHLEQFESGHIGMVIDGPWSATTFKNYCKFNVGAVEMYSSKDHKTTINGSGFGVAKTTKYPKEAYEALTSITGPDSEKKLADWGRALPARASVRDDYYTANSNITGLKEAVEGSLSIGVPYYPTKNFQQVYSAINENVESIFIGNSKASDVLPKTQTAINGILGK